MLDYFTFIMLGIALLALLYAIRAVIGYQSVRRDAEADYSYKSSQGMIPRDVHKEDYLTAYKRFYAPRSAFYVAAALAAVLFLTYPAISLIEFVLDKLWALTGRGDTMHPGFLVWKFQIFFGILAIWVAIIYFTARLYHSRAPISFSQEIEKAKLNK